MRRGRRALGLRQPALVWCTFTLLALFVQAGLAQNNDVVLLDTGVSTHSPAEQNPVVANAEKVAKEVGNDDGVAGAVNLASDTQNDEDGAFAPGSPEAETVAQQRAYVEQSGSEAKSSETEAAKEISSGPSVSGGEQPAKAKAAQPNSNQTESTSASKSTPAQPQETKAATDPELHPDCRKCHSHCKTDKCRGYCKSKWCSGERASASEKAAAKKASGDETASDAAKVKHLQAQINDQKAANALQLSANATGQTVRHIVQVYQQKTVKVFPSTVMASNQSASSDPISTSSPKISIEVTGLPRIDHSMPEDHSKIQINHDAELKANEFVRQAEDSDDPKLLKKAFKAVAEVDKLRSEDMQYFHNHLKERAETRHLVSRWKDKPSNWPYPRPGEEDKSLLERVEHLEDLANRSTTLQHDAHRSKHDGTAGTADSDSEDEKGHHEALEKAKEKSDRTLVRKVNRLSKRAEKLVTGGIPVNTAEAESEIKDSDAKEKHYKMQALHSDSTSQSDERKTKKYEESTDRINQKWLDSVLKRHPDHKVKTVNNDESKDEEQKPSAISDSRAHLDAVAERERDSENADAERAVMQLMRTAQGTKDHALTAQQHAEQAEQSMRAAARNLGLQPVIDLQKPGSLPDDTHPDASHSAQLTQDDEDKKRQQNDKALPSAVLKQRKKILLNAKARADEAVQKSTIRKEAHKIIQAHEKTLKKAQQKATEKANDAKMKATQKTAAAKAMGSAAGAKAKKAIAAIKKQGANSPAVQKEAEKATLTNKNAKPNKNAKQVAINKIKAKAKAKGVAAAKKATKEANAAEEQAVTTAKQQDRSKELTSKSTKRVKEAQTLKKETVDKLHRVQRKQGVRVDPKAITDAVDPVDSNSTAMGTNATSAVSNAKPDASKARSEASGANSVADLE